MIVNLKIPVQEYYIKDSVEVECKDVSVEVPIKYIAKMLADYYNIKETVMMDILEDFELDQLVQEKFEDELQELALKIYTEDEYIY